MVNRLLKDKLLQLNRQYPIITLTGPRQSGKSTLLRMTFPNYKYLSLEDPDIRSFAEEDPRGFLATYPSKVILDEVQRVPSLFSYLQTHTDQVGEAGMYCLAGSHNFLLMEQINQSLAGRTAVLKLLPFAFSELKKGKWLEQDMDKLIYKGAYPRLFDKGIDPLDYYPNYVQTYVERDVRLMRNIGDLSKFIRFVKLCAGRIGQLLNLSSLANECAISVPTAQSWVSLLEASYICYLLKPDHNNFAKRLVKTPKLYFYDTGLACSLLDIRSSEQVNTHFLRGGLFENLIINEFIKRAYNNGREPQLTFWRDSTGNEVDLLDYSWDFVQAYEIKSGATFSSAYLKSLNKWRALSETFVEHCHVIYGGKEQLKTSSAKVSPYLSLIDEY